MCCDSGGGGSAPAPQESEFSKALADIMRERQVNARKFGPLEDRLVRSVEQFQTPEFEAQQAGKAAGAVQQSFDQAAQQQADQMASMGINPAQGRYQFMNRALQLGRAGASAAAITNAKDAARRLAFDTLAGVSGRGDAKIGQAIGAAQAGGNLYNQSQANQIGWQNAQAQQDAAGLGGIGNLAGTALGWAMFSSRKVKRNVRGADDALSRARKMPAKHWRYVKGVGDGGAAEHTGPMAEDAKRAGISDGKMLNVADVAGTALAAVQQLDRKVRKLEARA